jgi:hypothetical protein
MVRDGRKCTDILCLIIFFAFLGAMGYLTAYAHSHGNLEKLTAPLDGHGKFCGEDPDKNFKDYPYLYLSNLLGKPNAIFASGICVKTCPMKATQTKTECYI